MNHSFLLNGIALWPVIAHNMTARLGYEQAVSCLLTFK